MNVANILNKDNTQNNKNVSSPQNGSKIAGERNREDNPLKTSIQAQEEMLEENLDNTNIQPAGKKKSPAKNKEFIKRKGVVTAISGETNKYNYHADSFD